MFYKVLEWWRKTHQFSKQVDKGITEWTFEDCGDKEQVLADSARGN